MLVDFGPDRAAGCLLVQAAAGRSEVLQKTMDFIIQVLNTPNEPRHKSGAMHMMESLANKPHILLRVNTWRVFDSLLTYENNARFMGGAIGFFLLHCFPSVL